MRNEQILKIANAYGFLATATRVVATQFCSEEVACDLEFEDGSRWGVVVYLQSKEIVDEFDPMENKVGELKETTTWRVL